MHDARAIANFFIDRSIETDRPVSALALLKVLYFAHGWHLANFNSPLVHQKFEAWKYGPVNRVVYEQIKDKKRQAIDFHLDAFDPFAGKYKIARAVFNDETTQFLNAIFDIYAIHDPLTLSDLTHERGSPWDMMWNKSKTGVVLGMLIPDDLIKDWFVRVETNRHERHRH